MSVSLLLQYGVIGLAVLISVYVVIKKQFPVAARRLQIRLAIFLLRDSRPDWLRRIGKHIAPVPRNRSGSCSGCTDCDPDQNQKGKDV
ncbi:MAG: hypothetical protein LBV45_07680 [Xanthomonadaceae bacterium]|jgi:hypothetical protein|nr:hypothetical protein [Xanthomonadaceae bacterium]